MTKKVRIENADTSDWKVLVQVFDKGQNGEPDTLVSEHHLDHPTAMTNDSVYLTATRYIVVKEKDAEAG